MTYKVKECREEKGLSQEELAKKSGVSRTIISRLESGKTMVTTTETLIKIANALGKKVGDIFLSWMSNMLHILREGGSGK